MIQAKYTVVLKTLIDNEKSKLELDKALSTYPMYTPKSKQELKPTFIPTREELNNRILRHYKYREIGFETVGRFLDELECTMCEIMPYYNELMFSADQDYNILYNVDYKKTLESTRQGNVESETDSTGSEQGTSNSETQENNKSYGKSVKSDTPQNNLSIPNVNNNGVAGADVVEYASEVEFGANDSIDNSTSNVVSSTANTGNVKTTGTNSDSESTVETTKGNFGVVSSQDLILKYRETIINIVRMIVEDERLSELFMRVY